MLCAHAEVVNVLAIGHLDVLPQLRQEDMATAMVTVLREPATAMGSTELEVDEVVGEAVVHPSHRPTAAACESKCLSIKYIDVLEVISDKCWPL